jgi:hydrogenase maturation protein HypF
MSFVTVRPANRPQEPERVRLKVRGAVQGVGFRPFVYRQAQRFGLAGWVANTADGVTVEVEGLAGFITEFVRTLRDEPPPHAAVTAIEREALAPCRETAFEIRESALTGAGRRRTGVLPDLATCGDCLRELFEPGNRRFRYPFINCTQCGPRYSIIEALPYDRARTTMRRFAMCPACRAEYDDPRARRFHAEPNACPECGPQVMLWDCSGSPICRRGEAVAAAVTAIRQNKIIAVKGLGGFHLVVDASNDKAVRTLRKRKAREEKPLAVMFPSLEAVCEAAEVSEAEAHLLASAERPIVLLRRRADGLAESVAPRNPFIGAMLPYTPLHHLLLADFCQPVVMTSGNIAEEPIVTDENEAPERLGGIADLFLVHDRPIVRPIDDSVTRIVAGRPQILRRARGYAPAPVVSQAVPPGILALGGHMKTTVALSSEAGLVLGQHVGDLEAVAARDVHAACCQDIAALYSSPPRIVVRDLHPDYHTSRFAEGLRLPVVGVQHHLAHVLACMAEHRLDQPVLGVAWDGSGYGTDGTIWGGEFVLVSAEGWRRVAHLRPFRLPGGEAAVREPRRSAFGLLAVAFGEDVLAMTGLPPVAAFSPAERATLFAMLVRGVNAPQTTSAGRLFDAVAAITGLRLKATYEGQAAAELEWAIDPADEKAYSFAVRNEASPWIVDWDGALRELVDDVRRGVGIGSIAARFHAGLVRAIATVASRIGAERVVLTGGCFQNAWLTQAAIGALRAAGVTPYWHERVPPNDGGLALGQAMWAARLMTKSEERCHVLGGTRQDPQHVG